MSNVTNLYPIQILMNVYWEPTDANTIVITLQVALCVVVIQDSA